MVIKRYILRSLLHARDKYMQDKHIQACHITQKVEYKKYNSVAPNISKDMHTKITKKNKVKHGIEKNNKLLPCF